MEFYASQTLRGGADGKCLQNSGQKKYGPELGQWILISKEHMKSDF